MYIQCIYMCLAISVLDPKPSTAHYVSTTTSTDVHSQATPTMYIIPTMSPTFSCDAGYSLHCCTTSQCVSNSSLSTADAVAITAVVGGLCSFTAGLLLGVLLTRCSVHCHRKQERGQTERPPVYEDIQPEMKADMELQHNEAYGHISH